MAKQKIYSIEGIVLSKNDHSEKDQIFHILTTESKKISVLAKYARVVPSRHNSGLDVFNIVQCQLHTGKFLPIVTQSRQIRGFPELFSHPDLLELGFKAIMATFALVPWEENSEHMYQKLLACLDQFTLQNEKMAQSALVQFLIQALEILGFIETSHTCQQCRDVLRDKVIWDNGRFLCQYCGRNEKNEKISPAQLDIICTLGKQSLDSIPENIQTECQSILPIIERQIGSLAQYRFFEKSMFALV